MSSKCNHCINKEYCDTCDSVWKDKFIPSDEVEKYFKRSRSHRNEGVDGYTYYIDNTSEKLIPTKSVHIHGGHYCPYCGELMFVIQKETTLKQVGYFCICEGARAEIEYKNEKRLLDSKHEEESRELKRKYRGKLAYNSSKLLEIKQREERRSFEFHHRDGDTTFFNTSEKDVCVDIEELIG